MAIKNYQTEFVFIILTYSNTSGMIHVLDLLNKYYPQKPIVIENNNKKVVVEKVMDLGKIKNPIVIENNEKNLGFAAACNKAARLAKQKFNPSYFVFLNDDVDFKSDWITPCIRQLKKNRWIATSPVLYKIDGKIENAGYTVLPQGKIKLIKKITDSSPIDGISATSLIFKSGIFLKLNGFDEKFFAYLEDVDLCLRAKKKGLRFGVTKEASIMHEGQKTSSKFKTRKAYLDFRNWFFLILKNWDRKTLILHFPSILAERSRNFWGIVKALFL